MQEVNVVAPQLLNPLVAQPPGNRKDGDRCLIIKGSKSNRR